MRSGSSTKRFARQRELCNEERTMRDFLAELDFSGMKNLNLTLPADQIMQVLNALTKTSQCTDTADKDPQPAAPVETL